MKQILKVFAVASIIGGIISTIYFLSQLSKDFHVFGPESIKLQETGQVGDFIGGVVGTIFSLAGFLILVLTLSEQTKFATKERFESKFFDLLKLHRENVKELETDNSSGRKEFHDIFMQFLKCREDLIPVFSKSTLDHVYEAEYLQTLNSQIAATNPTLDLMDLAKLNLPYLITFYGVGSDGKTVLKDILTGKYKATFIKRVIEFIAMKPVVESRYYANWLSVMKMNRNRKKVKTFELIRRLRNTENIAGLADTELVTKANTEVYPSDYVKFYGGHQYKLGHYFRHLFQTFSYINEQKNLTEREKYFYAKTLRAQLSTHEQALLFINSISFLGLVWDLCPEVERYYIDPFFDKRLKEKRLITKFNLIKNLPGQEIFGITYREFYPDVKYEHS